MGRDVDVDMGNGWIIALATIAAALLAVGAYAIFQGGDGGSGGTATVDTTVPVTQTLSPSLVLEDAQARLEAIRQQGASPALTAATVSEVLLAEQAVASQARDTALEIDRMLARPQ